MTNETTVTTSETTTTETAQPERDTTVEKTVENVVRIGRLWAVYGLEAARASLRATSETLRATSEILADVSRKIDERKIEERTAEQAEAI